MRRNDTKCKYMSMFPLKNLARKGKGLTHRGRVRWLPLWHLNMFLRVFLTIWQHWFRLCLGEEKSTSPVNMLSIGPRSLSDKNWEGPTGCPGLSVLNYSKNQCWSDKTVILKALTASHYLTQWWHVVQTHMGHSASMIPPRGCLLWWVA